MLSLPRDSATRLFSLCVALLLSSCRDSTDKPSAAGQGTAEAAPVISGPTLLARPVRVKGAAPQISSTPIADLAEVPSSELRRPSPADILEVALSAHFEWPTLPRTLRFAGTLPADAATALSNTRATLTGRLQAEGYLALTLTSDAFPLPAGTVLQARHSSLGHFLVWPGLERYRILPTGTLRALFRERRVDVTPILAVEPTRKKAPRRFGLPTEEVQLSNERGKVTLQLSTSSEVGRAGPLLCHFLLEFLAIAPENSACAPDVIPTAARFDFSGAGSLAFVVDSLLPRHEELKRLAVPPLGSVLSDGLPDAPGRLLSAEDRFRLLGSSTIPSTKLRNPTPYALFAVFDGVPLVLVAPGAHRNLSEVSPGSHDYTLRTFFGEDMTRLAALAEAPDSDLKSAADAGR